MKGANRVGGGEPVGGEEGDGRNGGDGRSAGGLVGVFFAVDSVGDGAHNDFKVQ